MAFKVILTEEGRCGKDSLAPTCFDTGMSLLFIVLAKKCKLLDPGFWFLTILILGLRYCFAVGTVLYLVRYLATALASAH